MLRSIHQPYTPSESLNDGAPATLFTVVGSDAKLDGTFEVADSVQIECEVGGRLKVGKRLVIGEKGSVVADVETVDAVIHGEYRGNMVATGSVEIAATGRVVGTVETDSLVISKGGFFNGKTIKLKQSQAEGFLLSGDGPGREDTPVHENQNSSPALPETDPGHTAEDQVLSPDDDPPADPPKRRGRAPAVPRRPRRKQSTTGHDHLPVNPEASQADGGPSRGFVVDDMAELLPPLPSGGKLFPEDLDLADRPPPSAQPEWEDLSPAPAVPRRPRRKQKKTGHDHHPPIDPKASQSERRPGPTSLVESMGEPLPPLPSRGKLPPEDLDPDRGPPPGDRLGRREMDVGRNMRSDSALRGDDRREDDRGIGREDWKRRPAPFPDDDPLGIR